MGRPPSNGGPSFRFNPVEVGEMEAILQAHNYTVPSREILEALAQRFSNAAERSGKVEVSGKQVWNWFQNRRYALRAKAARTSVPGQVNMQAVARDDQSVVRNMPQAPQPQVSQPLPASPNIVRSMPQVPQPLPVPSAQTASRNVPENSSMEFEAKSARDGAWYDVASFLSHKSLESGDPEAMVRFAGFGAEEDEWVNIRRHIRQRSLPCESSECVAVLPGDLILCFQEGKEQALYFDAHVLDAQRRRHDVRGCRCRFLVRYDHDQSEEIVPLRKICRRPETDHRLQQLHAIPINMNQQKPAIEVQAADIAIQKQLKQEERVAPSSMMTFAAPTNVHHTTESKLQTTSAALTTIPHATESKLPTTPAAPITIPHATESKLQTTPAAPITIPHATESKLQTAPAAPITIPHATESKLQTTLAAPITIHATESKLQPTPAAPTTIPHATESKLQTTPAAPPTIPHATESKLHTTSAAPTTIPHAIESKLQPSKAVDAENATAEANTISSNTVTVSTAASGGALPTPPQG